ncbi:hypothetical protein [Frankia sp. CIT1]|uniref:hypothetical protein n=1 Tax=Frankia sp. CIT1 TaxID=2880974 RepID=UPI001EF67D42|nr:hypothetical protein [Frankia sp. CIT1]
MSAVDLTPVGTPVGRACHRLRVATDIVDRFVGNTDVAFYIWIKSGFYYTSIPVIEFQITEDQDADGVSYRSRAADDHRLTGIDTFAREFGLTLHTTEGGLGHEGSLWAWGTFTHQGVCVTVYTLLSDPEVTAEARDRYTPVIGTGPGRSFTVTEPGR